MPCFLRMHNLSSRFLPLSSFGMLFPQSAPRFDQNSRGNSKAASCRLGVKPRIRFGYRECSCFSTVWVVFDVIALSSRVSDPARMGISACGEQSNNPTSIHTASVIVLTNSSDMRFETSAVPQGYGGRVGCAKAIEGREVIFITFVFFPLLA